MCHGGGFKGQNEIPRVAGQQHDYIVKQLTDFKERRRTNDAGNMASVSKTLSDEDIENLAQYLDQRFAETRSAFIRMQLRPITEGPARRWPSVNRDFDRRLGLDRHRPMRPAATSWVSIRIP